MCIRDRLLRDLNISVFLFFVFTVAVFQVNDHQIGGKNDKKGQLQEIAGFILVDRDIRIKEYFQYIDSIVSDLNDRHSYKISEHVLVRHNPWVIDSLANTDYYRMIEKDTFVYDQKEMLVLRQHDTIYVPDSTQIATLENKFKKTQIDINIPEYKLRIYEDSLKTYEFSVRVGRNESKYLEMAGRIESLKTKTGKGTIVKHVRDPDYYNPVNGHQYHLTNRDDNKTTKLPQIPFIETEINEIRNGQLIHPTTNPVTLGKAYSNGCIGTKESDAWIIYYYAPIGTEINIRYDLHVLDENGVSITLKDIYH